MLELTNQAECRLVRLPAGGNPSGNVSRRRDGARLVVTLPALLIWNDRRGITRRAYAVTRNVSDQGVYIECSSGVSIPLYRLVLFGLERHVRHANRLPECLRQGHILSAVYRVTVPKSSDDRVGLALRLIVGLSQAEAAHHAAMEAVHATAETLQATLEHTQVVEEMRRTSVRFWT